MGKKFLLSVSVAIILILFLSSEIIGDLSTGLTLYLKLNGNTQDSSGNNNQAIAIGALPSQDGIGGSYSFDGKNNYISAGSHTSEQKQYTISLRFKTGSTGTKRIFQRGKANACFYNPAISLDGGKLSVSESGCSSAGKIGGKTYPGVSFLSDQWNHIVVTRDDNIVKVYLNGKFEISDDSQPIPSSTTEGKVTIGASWASKTTYVNFFNGLVDEVKIWNRHLADDEIKTEFGVADLQIPTPTPIKSPSQTPIKTPTPVKSPSQTPIKSPTPATSPSPSPSPAKSPSPTQISFAYKCTQVIDNFCYMDPKEKRLESYEDNEVKIWAEYPKNNQPQKVFDFKLFIKNKRTTTLKLLAPLKSS